MEFLQMNGKKRVNDRVERPLGLLIRAAFCRFLMGRGVAKFVERVEMGCGGDDF